MIKKCKCGCWWTALPIRQKLSLFIGLIAAAVIALCIILLGTLFFHMRDFNEILGDSYHVNHTLVSFKEENNAFVALFESASDENNSVYRDARKNTRELMSGLQPDYGKHSVERYLLTQAVQNAYDFYEDECNFLLTASAQDTAYASRYYTTLEVADFIDGYFQQLMQETLDEGTLSYARKQQGMRILPAVSVTLSLASLLLAVVLGWMTTRTIVRPVLQMAESAERIAENDLDTPDIIVENRDEIGRLALVFNRMKDSMRKYILAESLLHQEELQKAEMERKLNAMQLSILQSQINPHFLFNTLTTIRSQAKIENARDTEELIQRLANLFRYNLQTSDAIVSLERELSIIEDYIYIQRRRFGARLRFEADIRVDAKSVTVPAFTLQPLVENAIIHGVTPKEEGGSIRVRIFPRAGFIHIRIADTGLGIPREQLALMLDPNVTRKGHLSHIGIGNVSSRLAILFPGSELKIKSKAGMGTVVRIIIPQEKRETEDV